MCHRDLWGSARRIGRCGVKSGKRRSLIVAGLIFAQFVRDEESLSGGIFPEVHVHIELPANLAQLANVLSFVRGNEITIKGTRKRLVLLGQNDNFRLGLHRKIY